MGLHSGVGLRSLLPERIWHSRCGECQPAAASILGDFGAAVNGSLALSSHECQSGRCPGPGPGIAALDAADRTCRPCASSPPATNLVLAVPAPRSGCSATPRPPVVRPARRGSPRHDGPVERARRRSSPRVFDARRRRRHRRGRARRRAERPARRLAVAVVVLCAADGRDRRCAPRCADVAARGRAAGARWSSSTSSSPAPGGAHGDLHWGVLVALAVAASLASAAWHGSAIRSAQLAGAGTAAERACRSTPPREAPRPRCVQAQFCAPPTPRRRSW